MRRSGLISLRIRVWNYVTAQRALADGDADCRDGATREKLCDDLEAILGLDSVAVPVAEQRISLRCACCQNVSHHDPPLGLVERISEDTRRGTDEAVTNAFREADLLAKKLREFLEAIGAARDGAHPDHVENAQRMAEHQLQVYDELRGHAAPAEG